MDQNDWQLKQTVQNRQAHKKSVSLIYKLTLYIFPAGFSYQGFNKASALLFDGILDQRTKYRIFKIFICRIYYMVNIG